MSWNFTPMPVLTPERLEQQLEILDLQNSDAAFLCGVSQATIYRWLSGTTPIPASVTRMFDLMIHAKQGAELVKFSWSTPDDAVEEPVDGEA
jgi:predicted transcriptional regulator